jgi:hypothetical protein
VSTKNDLQDWVEEALKSLGGRATIVDVARVIWYDHEVELRASGDLFYTWQYDMRWAAQMLRNSGRAKPTRGLPRGVWELA